MHDRVAPRGIRAKLRLYPALRDIRSMYVGEDGEITAYGRCTEAGDLWRVARLPRSLRLMIVVNYRGFSNLWEWQAIDTQTWGQRHEQKEKEKQG